ncbi:MAG TPA: OmpA family protein [Nitrospiria bacterium]|jgi:chemotaxis protein MotB
MRLAALLLVFILGFGLQSCVVSRDTYEKTNFDLIETQREVGKLEGVLEEARRRIRDLEKELKEFQGKSTRLEEELESVRSDRAQTIENLQLRIRDLNQKVSELQEQSQDLFGMRAKQTAEINRLQQLSESLKVEKEETTKQIKDTYEELVQELEGEIQEGAIKITRVKEKLSMNLVEKILFDSGSSELKPQGIKVLKKVGQALQKVTDKEIRVEGHTDNVPVSNRIAERFSSNWELSASRATTVARYLQEKEGVDPRRLAVSGYASYRPVVSNETPQGKAQNRRIEIVLVPLDLSEVLEELK